MMKTQENIKAEASVFRNQLTSPTAKQFEEFLEQKYKELINSLSTRINELKIDSIAESQEIQIRRDIIEMHKKALDDAFSISLNALNALNCDDTTKMAFISSHYNALNDIQ